MATYALFLRGVNVGGRNRLPMQGFRELLRQLGCDRVSTYIQSGNAVFDYAAAPSGLPILISESIQTTFGFAPRILMLDGAEFAHVMAANPFIEEMQDPRHLHVWMTTGLARDANFSRLASLANGDEVFQLQDKAFYLHAPAGIGRSKLAAGVEKILGVSATARNWRTMLKVEELLAALD